LFRKSPIKMGRQTPARLISLRLAGTGSLEKRAVSSFLSSGGGGSEGATAIGPGRKPTKKLGASANPRRPRIVTRY
jgi:hypothetical protein